MSDEGLCYVDFRGRRHCDHIHAEDLPANQNPGEIPADYYEDLPGWTAQFQTQYDERRKAFLEENHDTEIIDARHPQAGHRDR